MDAKLSSLADDLLKVIGDNHAEQAVTRWIDTGNPELNRIISGSYNGGLPYGRLVEIYSDPSCGKTALATYAMVEAQKAGGVAIFIDWERSFDVRLAQTFGLNTERPFWIYAKPRTWEEGNTLAAKACQAIRNSKAIPDDAPILVVFDSIASAVPKSVASKEIDELTMNDTSALSRVTSTTLKSMAQFAEDFGATYLYLNQTRQKIGVMFGDPTCLRGEVQVPFTDGTSATMRQIVDGKIKKEVWSYNESTKQIEPKQIVGWHNNGSIKNTNKVWHHIRASCPETKNGTVAVSGTNDHKVFIKNKGWINCKDVQIGDLVVTQGKRTFAGTALEFLQAAIVFDCHLAKADRRQTGALIFQDNANPDYVAWKINMLSKHLTFRENKIKAGSRYLSNYTNEIACLHQQARDPLAFFGEKWTALQLAIAIMDDGNLKERSNTLSLSFKRLRGSEAVLDAIGDSLYKSFGLTFTIRYGQGRIDFDTSATLKVNELISQFVPECMQYKLLPDYRGRYVKFELDAPISEMIAQEATVTEVRLSSALKSVTMYDITVEDNHNFLAGNVDNGFLVHNCTPGGKAMEFYASARLALTRQKIMDKNKDGEKEFVGQNIGVRCVKTKFTKPFQDCDLRLMYGDDGLAKFDNVSATLEFLIKKNLVEYTKPRVTWTDGKKYFVKELVKKLNDEPDGLEQLKVFLPKI